MNTRRQATDILLRKATTMATITVTTYMTGFFMFVQQRLIRLFESGDCGNHPGAGREDFTLTIENLPRVHVRKVLRALDDLYLETGILCKIEVLMD